MTPRQVRLARKRINAPGYNEERAREFLEQHANLMIDYKLALNKSDEPKQQEAFYRMRQADWRATYYIERM